MTFVPPPERREAQLETPQETLNRAVLYALQEGCFFPVPQPQRGATTRELIQWGAMRNLHAAIREFDLAGGFTAPSQEPNLVRAARSERPNLRAEDRHKAFAKRLVNLVLGDLEWVRAQGGRHSVCPLCHAVCEQDGGPGHAEDCPRIEIAREYDALYGSATGERR
jgi:hypothetical protein